METRQKIPVPRRSFLWSLNETSGEILTHIGPTEFTPSANDRIVRANDRGGYEAAPMEARPFVVARDGEYVVLANPVRRNTDENSPNDEYVPGGNKEKELHLGTKKIIPGPCAFPLWPGQSAEVRTAHKLGANHYLLVEVVGPLDEKARYYKLVIDSAELSSAVIDSGETDGQSPADAAPVVRTAAGTTQLRLGQRIVIQGRHTQLFIPPSGIEIVPPVEDADPTSSKETEDDGLANLPATAAAECAKLIAQVNTGLTVKQFSILKNELRHRADIQSGEKAIILSALDGAWEERQSGKPAARRNREGERRSAPADPFARRAVVLGPKEFCFLFDADGNARIVRGPARVFPGPYDTFLQRGSRRRVYDAYELAEHQALWLRIIQPISRERLAKFLPPEYKLDRDHYEAGHELIIRGLPSVFFPFIEADVINPVTREPHVGNDHSVVIINAIGIDQKSGIYVRDLRKGMVRTIRGEASFLVDPRFEEHVNRRIPKEQWNLWIAHSEGHKATQETAVTTPWAVSISVPNNEACLISSRHGQRVEIGPKVVLLEYEEALSSLKLSKGPSKDGHQTVTTAFLKIQGGRVADTFEIESSDFVKIKVRLGFAGHFEGPAERWFQVDDPVKLLADSVRARLREAARLENASKLLREAGVIVRRVLFGEGTAMRFAENGMVLDAVDVLSLQISDATLAELFANVQRESVKLQLQDTQASRRLESTRHTDTIDAEENLLRRGAVKRKSETAQLESEATHGVEAKQIELKAERKDLELDRQQKNLSKALEFDLNVSKQRAEVDTALKIRVAETAAKANEFDYKVSEAHFSAIAQIERERAKALAEADAVRLKAIQPELVGALHAASDTEVMKSAANNMNLVSLLGGKSPLELLQHLLAGTPLERTPKVMLERAAAQLANLAQAVSGKSDETQPETPPPTTSGKKGK